MSFVRSPCVSICALDENDVCAGCSRTGDEISQWGMLTPEQKRDVLRLCQQRDEKKRIQLFGA